MIWRRYDGPEAVLYLLEGELASHNCKGERENDAKRKFGDAARQVAAEEDTGKEPTSSEPNMCQSAEPSIQCPSPATSVKGTAWAMSEPTILAMGSWG